MRIQTATRVIGALINLGNDIVWTVRTIAEYTRTPSDDVADALAWCREAGYVLPGQYVVTIEGRDYYAACCRRGDSGVSTGPWKHEALTGIREMVSSRSGFVVSERSTITRAALPTVGYHGATRDDYDLDAIREARRAMSALAADLGISAAELARLHADGRIRVCNRGTAHLGVFDRRGERWQGYCRACRSAERKQKTESKGDQNE